MKNRDIFIFGLFALVVSFFFDKIIALNIPNLRFTYLNDFMIWISYFGSTFVILILMTTLLFWHARKRSWILPLWFSVLTTVLIVFFLKALIARQRPDILPLIIKTNAAFPSGHTAVAFSTLAILFKEFKKFKWFWLIIVILVGFSRLYLGVHYLSDVIAGALIGYGISCLVAKYEVFRFKRIKKRKR